VFGSVNIKLSPGVVYSVNKTFAPVVLGTVNKTFAPLVWFVLLLVRPSYKSTPIKAFCLVRPYYICTEIVKYYLIVPKRIHPSYKAIDNNRTKKADGNQCLGV
jgi:hypothetical protein